MSELGSPIEIDEDSASSNSGIFSGNKNKDIQAVEIDSTELDDDGFIYDLSPSQKEAMKAVSSVILNEFTFDGSPSLCEKFAMKNPCLSVQGLGVVGLPLSDRDARALASKGADDGNGRVQFDTTQFEFTKSEWVEWIKKVVLPAIQKALFGTPEPGIKVTMELDCMVLRQLGSKLTNHFVTDAMSGTFGGAEIVLSSQFSGGNVTLSYEVWEKTMDLASGSAFSTSVIAAYRDVSRVIESVQSGYRLSLVYRLNQLESTEEIPRFPESKPTAQLFLEALDDWTKQFSPEQIRPLPCILRRSYGDAKHVLPSALPGQMNGSSRFFIL